MKPGHGRFMLLTIVLLGMGSLLLLLRFHTATGQEGVDRAKEIFLPLVRKQRELSFSGQRRLVDQALLVGAADKNPCYLELGV